MNRCLYAKQSIAVHKFNNIINLIADPCFPFVFDLIFIVNTNLTQKAWVGLAPNWPIISRGIPPIEATAIIYAVFS